VKVVVQRVSSASVRVKDNKVGQISEGLMLLIGVAETDTESEVDYAAQKCAHLRIFEDDEGKLNRSILDVNGAVLAISQFTLLGDTRRGRRPSFIKAARPEKGEKLYNYFIELIKELGIHVESGIFGAMMDVELVNTGPVTILIDTDEK